MTPVIVYKGVQLDPSKSCFPKGILTQNLHHISSCECNKVVSAFWSFCRRSHFVFKFLLFFIVFRCFISIISIELLLVQAWSKACAFLPAFPLSTENSILPKMQIRPCCIHMMICIHLKQPQIRKKKISKTFTVSK